MQHVVTCLLIDNDEEDQEIFAMALQEVDPTMQCIYAENGVDALNLFHSDALFVPSFIFIDINMPLMNGAECLEEMRKIERLNHVPIYIYSTTADPQSLARVKQLGANQFIIKPTSFARLVEILSQLFESHKTF